MTNINRKKASKSTKKNKNLTWFNGFVTRADREEIYGHKSAAIWFTGLSASGKSTIAHHLEKLLFNHGCSTFVFDGDNVRHGLCSDLGFAEEDRRENIRRIGEMVKLFLDAGIIALTAFISPYKADREKIRSLLGDGQFFEVFVDCPIEVCEKRDQKGIYKKAKTGEIKNFTGISAPYERPDNPELIVESNKEDALESAGRIFKLLMEKGII